MDLTELLMGLLGQVEEDESYTENDRTTLRTLK